MLALPAPSEIAMHSAALFTGKTRNNISRYCFVFLNNISIQYILCDVKNYIVFRLNKSKPKKFHVRIYCVYPTCFAFVAQ